MKFKPGDKVVCIDNLNHLCHELEIGNLYTVRKVYSFPTHYAVAYYIVEGLQHMSYYEVNFKLYEPNPFEDILYGITKTDE